MLDALPPEDATFYAEESNVVDPVGKSAAIQADIEEVYGFLGGEQREWVAYHNRDDLPAGLWDYYLEHEVAAMCGVSAVKKKNGRLRMLLMACSTNYMWVPGRGRRDFGLGG